MFSYPHVYGVYASNMSLCGRQTDLLKIQQIWWSADRFVWTNANTFERIPICFDSCRFVSIFPRRFVRPEEYRFVWMKTDSIGYVWICWNRCSFVGVCADSLGQISCEMLDTVKMQYSGKVDQEIAKYCFGDPMLQRDNFEVFHFLHTNYFLYFF